MTLDWGDLAVILGVAFVAGSYIFTDSLERAFTGLTSGAVGDVVVRPGERIREYECIENNEDIQRFEKLLQTDFNK